MNVSCTECQSVFRIDPSKIPAGGVRARCSICGSVLPVSRPARSPDADASAGGLAASVVTPVPTPAVALPVVAHEPTPPVPDIEISSVAEDVPQLAPRAGDMHRDVAPAAAHASPPRPQMTPTPNGAIGAIGAAPVAPESLGPGTARRPVNPYMANDPGQKARRLARALISDLVAYHPQRREEGLRTGSLKTLFKDEIRKSYDEYVEQVGAPLAESTTYFRDALNDVLAGGRRVF